MRAPVSLLSGLRRRRPAENEQSVIDKIADVPAGNFRTAPRHAATVTREPSQLLSAPTEELPADGAPQPSWTPKPARPHAETKPVPLPVAGRPYVGGPLDRATVIQMLSEPEIGDSMPAPAAEPAQAALFEAAPVPPMAVLYTEPGWARIQMSRWIARGEWEDVHALLDREFGRNAAEYWTGYRHSRETIGGQVRQWCAALECPGLAEELLRRTHEFTVAARAAVAEAGAA